MVPFWLERLFARTTAQLCGQVTRNAASSLCYWISRRDRTQGTSTLCNTQTGARINMTPEQIEKLPYRPCAGIMLLNAQGLVFVGQRKDRTTDAWQMPQGGVEKGETPRDAALRELEEETGISRDLVTVLAEAADWVPYDLPHDLVPQLWKGKYRGQEQKWFLMRFNGEDTQVNIATEHQEFSAWKWMPMGELLDSIVPFKRAVYEAVLGQFEGHL